MYRCLLTGLIAGCIAMQGCSGTVIVPQVLQEENVTLSGGQPLIVQGVPIGVDGLPPGEMASTKVRVIQMVDGRTGIDIDSRSPD